MAMTRLLAEPSNDRCIDCGALDPRWAVVTIGCFIRLECAREHHRPLGVHIRQPRSVDLDSWTRAHLNLMEQRGNAYVQAMYFPALPDDMNPWKSDSVASRLTYPFILEKYDRKLFFVHEGD